MKGTRENNSLCSFLSKKTKELLVVTILVIPQILDLFYVMSLLVQKNYIVHVGSLSWLFFKFHQEVYWLGSLVFISNKWQLSWMGNIFFVGILPSFNNLHEHII